MIPNNTLRFPSALIDFAADVGIVGQDHESFPGPNQQPRYDWLLMWFISLLSNQSSYDEPTEFRQGSLWFDLSTITLKIYSDTSWVPVANVLEVAPAVGTTPAITLSAWYAAVQALLSTTAPELTFSGSSSTNNNTAIPVPGSLQPSIDLNKNRPFLWINGSLIDPRNVRFDTKTTIELLNGIKIMKNDTFTVLVKNITNQLFHVPSVVL